MPRAALPLSIKKRRRERGKYIALTPLLALKTIIIDEINDEYTSRCPIYQLFVFDGAKCFFKPG
jgi:hypothetical protein